MKRIIPILICFLLPLSSLSAMTIMLDPGHGGHDRGATNAELKESVLALEITNKLGSYLEKDKNFKVHFTRSTDEFIPLEERAHLAEKHSADLLISIHLNSSSDKRASGNEIFFQNQLPPDEESLYLAKLENSEKTDSAEGTESNSDLQLIVQDLEKSHRVILSSQLSESLHKNWGVKSVHRKQPIRQAPFVVVSKSKVPSVLVEVGYISNPKEAKLLSQSDYQDKIAKGLYLGLKEYKELVDKQRPKNLD